MTASLDALREQFPRVAVVHDWFAEPGGSEDVVLGLLDMFPDADLFTSFYDPRTLRPGLAGRPMHVSAIHRVPRSRDIYPLLVPFMQRGFTGFDLSGYDLVLSSSHAHAKSVIAPPGVPHVCYCHTPMRYAWDPTFLRGERIPGVLRPFVPLGTRWLRRQDLRGAKSPSVMVANSRNVAERIDRFYGRPAEVVYPPVDVNAFRSVMPAPQDYYLVLGRVVPYKRVDIAVEAAARLGRRLIVAGDGRALPDIRARAAGGVEILGRVSDSDRLSLMSGARAVLFCAEEDFGIVPVEAQAAGVPVIAYGRGGARETVVDGQTGVLFERQDAVALADAILRFESLTLDPEQIRANAERFSAERFCQQMAAAIARAAGFND